MTAKTPSPPSGVVFSYLSFSVAETAIARSILDDGLVEVGLMEVWELHLREIKFGVGILPEHKVAEAKLTTGTNH